MWARQLVGSTRVQSICYGDPRFLYRRCINTKLVGGRAEPRPPPPPTQCFAPESLMVAARTNAATLIDMHPQQPTGVKPEGVHGHCQGNSPPLGEHRAEHANTQEARSSPRTSR